MKTLASQNMLLKGYVESKIEDIEAENIGHVVWNCPLTLLRSLLNLLHEIDITLAPPMEDSRTVLNVLHESFPDGTLDSIVNYDAEICLVYDIPMNSRMKCSYEEFLSTLQQGCKAYCPLVSETFDGSVTSIHVSLQDPTSLRF